MKFETLKTWIEDRKKEIEGTKEKEVYPLFEVDIINAINDKQDYNEDNILNLKVHTTYLGGMTYVYYGKHQILSVSRNFNKGTIGITISKFDQFVNKSNKKPIEDFVCLLIENLLFTEDSSDEENEILLGNIKKDKFGLYRFQLGEIEFEE